MVRLQYGVYKKTGLVSSIVKLNRDIAGAQEERERHHRVVKEVILRSQEQVVYVTSGSMNTLMVGATCLLRRGAAISGRDHATTLTLQSFRVHRSRNAAVMVAD